MRRCLAPIRLVRMERQDGELETVRALLHRPIRLVRMDGKIVSAILVSIRARRMGTDSVAHPH